MPGARYVCQVWRAPVTNLTPMEWAILYGAPWPPGNHESRIPRYAGAMAKALERNARPALDSRGRLPKVKEFMELYGSGTDAWDWNDTSEYPGRPPAYKAHVRKAVLAAMGRV